MRSTLFFLVFLFSLTACVTTETSSFTKNKSVEKEVEARVQLALRYLQQGDPEMAIYHMKEIVDKQSSLAVTLEHLKSAEGNFDAAGFDGGPTLHGRRLRTTWTGDQGKSAQHALLQDVS